MFTWHRPPRAAATAEIGGHLKRVVEANISGAVFIARVARVVWHESALPDARKTGAQGGARRYPRDGVDEAFA
jgi:hypothetical protein